MAFPFHEQETNYTCGAACMRMVLEFFGIKKTEKQLIRLLGTNKVRGTWHKDFPRILEKYKLTYVVERSGTLEDIKRYMKGGYEVIVGYMPGECDHYSVVKKIDNDFIYFWDPSKGPDNKEGIKEFKRTWKSDPRFEEDRGWFVAIKRP